MSALDAPKRLMRWASASLTASSSQVAVALTNIMTSICGGNQISDRFGCEPMTVVELFECGERNRDNDNPRNLRSLM